MIGAVVLRSLGAVVGVVALGFVMGFSPSLYGVTVYLLTRVRQSWTALLFLTGGLAFGSTLALVVFRIADPDTLATVLGGQVGELMLTEAADYVAGAAFLVVGIVVAVRPHRPRTPIEPPRLHESHPQRLFGIGLANAVIGVSGLATMYVTGRLLTQVSADLAVQALAYLLFLAALVGPYLALAYLWHRIPRLAEWATRGYERIARFNHRHLLAGALLGAGVVFIGLAIWAPHAVQP